MSYTIAVQGTKGAYSQSACERLFSPPAYGTPLKEGGSHEIMFLESFDSVFNAVDKGMCKYGILPLENSLHGSVAEVYDLMSEYKLFIVKSIKMEINHVLLSNHGSFAPQIKEIYSHEQALAQCSRFIKNLSNVKVVNCANTAVAARTVAEDFKGRTDVAAIANPNCASLYDLSIISKDIQNNPNNYTRFICISKEQEMSDNANQISLMFTVEHKPGSLYEFIGRFAKIGVNLTKLESRPIAGSDFEFMFYAELEASMKSQQIVDLIAELQDTPQTLIFLGNYYETNGE